MSRITLVSYFDDAELKKVDRFIDGFGAPLCKVPYGINDAKRYEIDNLPYHFTVFATDKNNQAALLNVAHGLKIDEITLKINSVKIMHGKKGSLILYFGIEENEHIKQLQRIFYTEFPWEKYNPDYYLFHMTLHIDTDTSRIYELQRHITSEFEPFCLKFNKLALFDYPGDLLEIISLS